MNNPKYIELLVNPQKKCLIIRTALEGKTSHRVMIDRLNDNKQCYELYSHEFINEIQKVVNNLESFRSYRISGLMNAAKNAACFSLENATAINSGKENDFNA